MYSTVAYLIISAVFDLVVPYTAVTVIYILIKIKLNKNSHTTKAEPKTGHPPLSQAEPTATATASHTFMNSTVLDNMTNQVKADKLKQKREMKKNKRFSIQLIAMNACYIGCFTMSFILSFRYVIDDFNNKFYYFRQLLRIFNVLFQALVPLVSLYFNPNISIKKIKDEYFSKQTVKPTWMTVSIKTKQKTHSNIQSRVYF